MATATPIEPHLWKLAAERARRGSDALRLYRPFLPEQQRFHRSLASERLIRGGTRSGKSTCAAAEVASAALGIPLTMPDGTLLPHKYPQGRPLRIWAIGYDQKHLGQTIHRLLFQPGLFEILRDPKTRAWEAFNPLDPGHQIRRGECRPAPPLIPRRYLNGEPAWSDKKTRVFERVELWNETEIFGFVSTGEPKQGDPVDLIWVNEDIAYPRHVHEWEDRLSDRKGRLIWDAFPHMQNDAILRLSQRAYEDRGQAQPDVEEFRLTFSKNPFIDGDEKRKRLKGRTPEEIAARDRGEFVESALVFPEFSPEIHGLRLEGHAFELAIEHQVRGHAKAPPFDWTHYLVVDPGHTVQAGLLASVPPPELGEFCILWAVVHLKNRDADDFAKEVKSVLSGRKCEAFLIDTHAAKQTPMGHTERVMDRYSRAFADVELESYTTGHNFLAGSDNKQARIMAVREGLQVRKDGQPRIKVVLETTEQLQRELRNYRKKVSRDETTDEPIDRHCDTVVCLQYLMAYDPQFVRREQKEEPKLNGAARYLIAQESARQNKKSTVWMGAGSIQNLQPALH